MIRFTATIIYLAGSIFINNIPVFASLPSSSNTIKHITAKRPIVTRPVIRVAPHRSTATFNSSIGMSQSSNWCFQVDENSKVYIRSKGGSSRYYPANSPNSYGQTMVRHPRCN